MVQLQSSARGDHQVNKNSAPGDRQDIYLEGFDSIPQVNKNSNVDSKLHCDGVASICQYTSAYVSRRVTEEKFEDTNRLYAERDSVLVC